MILYARLLWSIKVHEKIFENKLQMMHFDVYFDKISVEIDHFYIEIMML